MGLHRNLKILVVDDDAFYRQLLCELMAGFRMVEVVGTAENGRDALLMIESLQPDLLLLDVEMPVMDGLRLLQVVRQRQLAVDCIMFSPRTVNGSEATVQALELGAFDFVAKPGDPTSAGGKAHLRAMLASSLLSYQRHKWGVAPRAALPTTGTSQRTVLAPLNRQTPCRIIAIGVSTGGPEALARVIPLFPAHIGVPVVLVQHMPPVFTHSLAQALASQSQLAVREARNGEPLLADTVYVAPGGRQMKVASSPTGRQLIRITDDPPELSCKPAVNYLFRSVAREYGAGVTGVIMTGMGDDGREGLRALRAEGAFCIAQSEETCAVYGMPKASVDAGLVDVIAPLHEITSEIMKTLHATT